MSNVLIDREKIDILANAISDKSGVPVTMTLDEMVEAVDGIENNPAPTLQAKTYTVDSAGTETITADSGYDGLSSVEVNVPSGNPDVTWANRGFYTESNQRKWRVRPYCDFPDGEGHGWMGYSIAGDYLVCSAVPSNTYITPTESAQTIGGANYMMEGAVTVNAIPSNYVGSGITQRSSSDLTASGATVTVPSGYYSAQASKAVASGTAGTPTATKGTVSNHQVSVTPSVTNTTGYITGGTKTGTAVTVSASELASGNKAITQNGTDIDVVGYSTVSVDVQGGGGSVTQDQDGYIVLPSTGGGGAQITTGTFTGGGGNTQSISCSFVPDLIYVHGDLSSDPSLRGVDSVIIIKNTAFYVISDGASSASEQALWWEATNITGYNETNQLGEPYATYSNGTLSFNMVENTSSARFNASITYSYTLIKWS